MLRPFLIAASTAAVVAAAASLAVAKKDEPKAFIHGPKTWEAAVAEGKALNLPIVVHSHGFY